MGTVTLIVDPVNRMYTDAAGVHSLPWHETPPYIKQQTTVDEFGSNIAAPEGLWAYTARSGLLYQSVEVVDSSTFFNTTAQAMFTATNATKTYPSMFSVVQWLKNNWADLDEQQFWEVMGLTYSHGVGHGGTFNAAKLVSTGGDVTLTTPANANLSDTGDQNWYAAAIVINASANDRQIRFTANGVENAAYTLPQVAPALSYGEYTAYGYLSSYGFTAGQPLGITIKGTLTGETFYVIQMGFLAGDQGDRYGPMVHTHSADLPDSYFVNPHGLPEPIPVFSGTSFLSQGRMGETFWYCPLSSLHIPDETEFTVVTRNHPMHLPFDTWGSSYWSIQRIAEAFDNTRGGLAISVGQASTLDNSVDDGSLLILDLALYDKEGSQAIDYLFVTSRYAYDYPSPLRQKAPFTTALTFQGNAYTLRQGAVQSEPFPLSSELKQGWMELDSEDYSPVYLMPGGSRYHGSYGMSREHAIFSRPLTDGEWAYLSDPDSVWSLGMFDEPATARVTGLAASLYRGDDREFEIEIQSEDGDPVALYGLTVWLTMKTKDDGSADDLAALEKFSAEISPGGEIIGGTGLAIHDAAGGVLRGRFTVGAVPVKYDVQVQNLNGDIQTIAYGEFSAQADVTKRETLP